MEEANFIFTSDPIEIKSENGGFFVEGYISTSDLDLVNDIVTKSCILDMAEQMRNRVIKFDVEHEAFRGKSKIEREINKTKIPVAKVEDFLIDKKGIKVRAKLNKNSTRFDEVKGSIEDGFLDAFSIAYIPIKAIIQEKDGMEIRLLDKINLLNVAFTGNPVNTEARMTNVFAKSLEFLEENNIHKSEIIKLQEVKMTEDTENTQEVNSENGDQPEAQESSNDAVPENGVEENTEAKAIQEDIKALKEKSEAQEKEIADLKAKIKAPVRKSPMEQEDKSEQFKEVKGKSLNPLDVIC